MESLIIGGVAALYTIAATVGFLNCQMYKDWQAAQKEEPAVVETVEDVPELEEVAQDG